MYHPDIPSGHIYTLIFLVLIGRYIWGYICNLHSMYIRSVAFAAQFKNYNDSYCLSKMKKNLEIFEKNAL